MVAIALVIGLFICTTAVVETGNWGLGFGTEGEPPTGSASEDSLEALGARYLGDTDEKVIYLTFDAGYENGQMSHILDVLAETQVPACFFLVGNYLETEPDLVRRMVAEGHTVGNHTYHHYDMSKIGDFPTFQAELQQVEGKYLEVVGEEMPKYYRPPQGIYSEENLKMAQELGYQTVFWSLAYVDWYQDDQPTAEEAFDKLLPRIHNGAVVLLHSTSATNGEILSDLIQQWREMGYEFGTMEELFA
ncbi:MAG: polysaccharide deacetylase family protein [Eubacteriales bacterium]